MSSTNIKSTLAVTAAVCLSIFTAVCFTSCRKEKSDKSPMPVPTAKFDMKAIMDCHATENRFPTQILSRIDGSWLWISNTCYMTGDTAYTADKHVIVTFTDAGRYSVIENSKVESEGNFKLTSVGDNTWSLDTEYPSAYLNGSVYLCKNEVVFFSSYMDGCDYYFVRQQ